MLIKRKVLTKAMWPFKSEKEQKRSNLVKKKFNLNSNQGRNLLANSMSLIAKLRMLYEKSPNLKAEISQTEKDLIENLSIFLAEKITHNTLNKEGERRRLSQELQSLKSIAYKAK